MFNFEVWEGLKLSWLHIDREVQEGKPTVDWDYLIDLPSISTDYKHVVQLVEAPLGIDVLAPCEFEEAADAKINCQKCGV